MKFVMFMLMLFVATSVAANPCGPIVENGGQYKGTDPVDGGDSYRTFIAENDVCTMVGGDTWHGPCGYGVPAVLKSELGAVGGFYGGLEGNWDLDCQKAPTNEIGDRSLAVRYTRDLRTGLLTEQLLDPDTGAELGRPPIKFYRVNK